MTTSGAADDAAAEYGGAPVTIDEAARLALAEARGLTPPAEAMAVLRKVHIALVACREEPDRAGVLDVAAWAIVALSLSDGDAPEAPAVDLGAIRERAETCPGSVWFAPGPVVRTGYAEQIINRAMVGADAPICYRRERKGVTYADHERNLLAILKDVLAPAYQAQADREALLEEVRRLRAEVERLSANGAALDGGRDATPFRRAKLAEIHARLADLSDDHLIDVVAWLGRSVNRPGISDRSAPGSVGPGTREEQDRMRACPKNALHPLQAAGFRCSCGYEGRA